MSAIFALANQKGGVAKEKVDFDTFCKSDFRAVKVKACECSH